MRGLEFSSGVGRLGLKGLVIQGMTLGIFPDGVKDPGIIEVTFLATTGPSSAPGKRNTGTGELTMGNPFPSRIEVKTP